MKVIIFGSSGMIGQGVLRECLQENVTVENVLLIGRSSVGVTHAKVKELVLADLTKYQGHEAQLNGFDACFFCLGTPSAGKSEAEYHHITYDFAMAAAENLLKLNAQMTFIYVSGEGADSTEKGSVMWARVRGKLENSLLRMPFKAVYIFRPGVIQPLHGIQSRTTAYRVFYSLTKPLLPLLRSAFPSTISTTEDIGRAMISVVQTGYEKKILRTPDFRKLSHTNSQPEKNKEKR